MPTTAKGTPYVVSTDLVANYPTVSSDLADHIDDNLAYNAVSINAQTGTTYTFVLADASEGKLVTASNAAASTYTVPPQSSVTWAAGAVLRILNQGAGTVTLVGGAGVTLSGSTLVLSQYQSATLTRTGSNAWTVTGISAPAGLTLITAQTMSATATLNINNCFSSTYQNYYLALNYEPSTGMQVRVRLRAGGTDNTSNLYYFNNQYFTSAAATASLNNGNPQTYGVIGEGVGTQYGHMGWDIYRPNDAVYTRCTGYGTYSTNSMLSYLVHADNYAADGITIYTSTGTMSGTCRVYGYRS